MKQQQIMQEMDLLEEELASVQEKIHHFEPDPYEFEERYDDLLNECNEVNIGGLTYSPSEVLKAVDPIAYRCGLSDYVDSLDLSEMEEYQELEERCNDIQEQIDNLQEEIEEYEIS